MSRAFGFSTDLYNCYAVNAPYLEDYFYLKGSVRKDLCLSYRRKLKDYVNSDEFNFYDVAGSILQQRAGKNNI